MISMLVAAGISFLITVLMTPVAVRRFRRANLGQFIREEVEGHAHKHGTPTMGGLVMIAAVVISVGIMMVAARPIGDFVHRHPTMKMLALSFLLLIGTSLVAEGFEQHCPEGKPNDIDS